MSKFKIGDKVVLKAGLDIDVMYNRITLLRSMVNTIQNHNRVIQVFAECGFNRCKLNNGFIYDEDMLELIPRTLQEIASREVTCCVEVFSAEHAKMLDEIFNTNWAECNFTIYRNRDNYNGSVTYSFIKGRLKGFCYADWYRDGDDYYGEIYSLNKNTTLELITNEEEEKPMTNQEQITELKKQIEDINAQIKKLEATNNVLDNYYSALKYGAWIIDHSEDDNIYCCSNSANFPERIKNYEIYPTESYTKMAFAMQKFNNMLLAFKWCYDRNYKPDWDNYDYKYRVEYNTEEESYQFSTNEKCVNNEVYFSSVEIAKKCADWLNEIDPNGDLIK